MRRDRLSSSTQVRRRLHLKRAEPIGKHVSDFDQSDRRHGSHRPEVGEDPKHELGAPKHAVFFIGYCDPSAPGHQLRTSVPGDIVQLNPEVGPKTRECRVESFDFSSHAPREGLRAYANRLSPKKILLVHGDPPAAEWMRTTLSADLPDCEVIVPKPGMSVSL